MFDGEIKLPKYGDEDFEEKLFLPDKIRNVQLLSNVVEKFNQVTLSIQFTHCIATASLNTEKFTIHIKAPDMVKRFQIRGDADEVFYARNGGERDQIIKLFLHDEIQDKIVET